MGAKIIYFRMYNIGTDEQSSRTKNYELGLNHNWDWVFQKYPNWDLFPTYVNITWI